MTRVFAGYDRRGVEGFHVFLQSAIETSPSVVVEALVGDQADGSTTFTYERFTIPERLGWRGWALFVDGADMLLRADLAELMALADSRFAVQVVKHDYRTRHPRKFVGTPMECDNRDYPRKNWSSVVLWNCDHPAHLTQPFAHTGLLHQFPALKDSEIGDLPIEWNWLVDEYGENSQAKLLHWTAGVPGFAHYRDAPHADEWHVTAARIRGAA